MSYVKYALAHRQQAPPIALASLIKAHETIKDNMVICESAVVHPRLWQGIVPRVSDSLAWFIAAVSSCRPEPRVQHIGDKGLKHDAVERAKNC